MQELQNEVKIICENPRNASIEALHALGIIADDLYEDLVAYNASGDRIVVIYDCRSKNTWYIVCIKKRDCKDVCWEGHKVLVFENVSADVVMSMAGRWLKT